MGQKSEQPRVGIMNHVFVFFLLGAVLCAGYTGKMKEISDASVAAAKDSVTLAINLVGFMTLWLGLVRILEAGGLMERIAAALRPLMTRLFPEVPADHPAMGSMLLNISANVLGLGNAATPFGIKAMTELNKLNPLPGTATNAMCLFLAINTSSVTILPLGVIGVRAAAGATRPAEIFITTLIATTCSTVVGVATALYLARRDRRYVEEISKIESSIPSQPKIATAEDAGQKATTADYRHLLTTASPVFRLLGWGALVLFFLFAVLQTIKQPDSWTYIKTDLMSFWLLPLLIVLIASYGLIRGVKMYEAVTEGGKQGFDLAVKIIPFLVAILVSVGMFRASGAMEYITVLLSPLTSLINLPADVLPVAILRPLSGSGSFALMSSVIQKAPDSYESFLVSTIQGSTETTFYVLAIYFGSVGITRMRHAIAAGLMADIAGVLGACAVCSWMYQA